MDNFETGLMPRHSGLQRTIAGVIVTCFLALNTAPAAAAIRKEIEQPTQAKVQIPAPRQDQTTQLLEHLQAELAALQVQVKPSRDLVIKRTRKDEKTGKTITDISIIGTPAAPKVKELQERIAKIAASLRKEDEATLAEFEADRQHILDHKLPAMILERHAEAVKLFKAKSAEVQDRLDKLGKAGSVVALYQQSWDLSQQIKSWNPEKHQPFDPKNMPFGSADPKVRTPKTTPADLRKVLIGSLPQQPRLDVAERTESVDAKQLAAIEKAARDGDRYDIPADPLLVASAGSVAGLMAIAPTPGPEYLAPTEDAQITLAIQTKAAELHGNPVEIYNWVRNNIEFIPSYGSIQGSDMTLQTLRGNAFDTSSLLIALLRASGVPARYVYGVVEMPIEQAMNWVGGVTAPAAALNLLGQGGIPSLGLVHGGAIKAVRLEHVWVEAFVDYYPSRGAKNLTPDAWVPMDASFKQYEYISGLDLQQDVPFASGALIGAVVQRATVNEAQGWFSNLDQNLVKERLADYQERLRQYLENQPADAAVLPNKAIQKATEESLSATLPVRLASRSSAVSALGSNLRYRFSFELQDQIGTTIFQYSDGTPQLAGKKFALSFRPATPEDADVIVSYLPRPHADGSPTLSEEWPKFLPGYLITVIPELTLDGSTIATGSPQKMGGALRSIKGFTSPYGSERSREKVLVAGEYHAIGLDLQGISSKQLLGLKADIEAAGLKMEDPSAIGPTKHEFTGNVLQSGILTYFAVGGAQDRLRGRLADVVDFRMPSFGTFQSSLDTQYRYGVPRNVQLSGVIMDVDQIRNSVETYGADLKKEVQYVLGRSAHMSVLENVVPQQLLGDVDPSKQAVSAVKALHLAAIQGQRVFYFTENNLSSLSQLNVDEDIKVDIRNSVAAGQVAIIHEEPIVDGGFRGVGYILSDPLTGAGAYKISSGADGAKLGSSIIGAYLGGFGGTLADVHAYMKASGTPYQKILKVLAGLALAVTVVQIIFDPKLNTVEKIAQIMVATAAGIAGVYIGAFIASVGIGILPVGMVVGFGILLSVLVAAMAEILNYLIEIIALLRLPFGRSSIV